MRAAWARNRIRKWLTIGVLVITLSFGVQVAGVVGRGKIARLLLNISARLLVSRRKRKRKFLLLYKCRTKRRLSLPHRM